MPRKNKYEVPVRLLRWRCDPKSLKVTSTEDIKQSREIIGQERALRALRMGLEMKHPGYNVFVTGYTGTGRMTTIKLLLAEFEKRIVPLQDRCYVHNFRNEDQPLLITLNAGEGRKLNTAMDELLNELLKNIPAVFESKRFQEERKRLIEHFQARQRSVLKDFERKVKDKSFEVVQVQVGGSTRPEIAPVVGNQPINFEQLESLVQQGLVSKQQFEQMTTDRALLENSLELVLREMRNIDRKAKDSIDELMKKFISPVVKEGVQEIRTKYPNEKLGKYLNELEEYIMRDLDRFRPPTEDAAKPSHQREEDNYIEFKVNVILDNSETKGIPIIVETNPKGKNLFGSIEREVDRNGVWRTNLTLIKPGSLLQADGGFIVLNVLDTLSEAGVWNTLKRTLRNGLLEIQALDGGSIGTSSALKPEPIPIDVKVVMIGDANVYYYLYDLDDDFKKVFKVRADFDTEMNKEDRAIEKYMSFIKMVCDDEKLRPFDRTAIAAVIEYGARLVGHQKKLSTRFTTIADVVREANYWATKEDARHVTAAHVLRAVSERIERVNLAEEKISEMILDGTIMIDSEGMVVGQVNGLSVYDMGDYIFGKPARITVRTSIGRQGVINIEREAAMSGPTHNKGVLILTGYMQSMYAQNKPLVINASIAFEQSYSGVDGDSASSTEIYAILSSIADIPLRQDIAVTGSVNQKGEIQPIGGVNQKVEGFFNVCKARGLTGTQGVIIPHQNVQELMLRHDVIDAVKAGTFHIHAIKNVDEGLEILTGRKAGKRLAGNSFEKDSIHALVDRKLTEYCTYWRELQTLI